MCNKYLYPIIFISLIVLSRHSQGQAVIRGHVYDAESGALLAGANLMIEELNKGTISDGEGNFVFKSILPGNYTVSAGFIGYQPLKKKIQINENIEYEIIFPLFPAILSGQSVEITSTRAIEGKTPVTFSNLSRKEISEYYTAADVPMILNRMPNTFSYSLTGDNIGYSFLSIRGFDQKRVGVMINDIPMNDPEDHQVYWVDLPDLAESTEDIQVQRGVGCSIYGTSTFGGAINILTKNYSSDKFMRLTIGGGSYNTRKALAEYNSGLIDNKYGFYARVSKISSDGYRRDSGSDLRAYFFGMERLDRDFVTRINIVNGHERTHPDWYGIDVTTLAKDRRFKWETYDDTVDDFSQPQIQLINEWNITAASKISNTLYYIQGSGYYENLKETEPLTGFGMLPYDTFDPTLFGADSLNYYQADTNDVLIMRNGEYRVINTDLVRQKWVKKNQYGWIGKYTYAMGDGLMTLGASAYLFDSDHYGKVIWAKHMPSYYSPERIYYGYNGERYYGSGYFNILYNAYPNTNVMANLLYEFKNVKFRHRQEGLFEPIDMNRYTLTYNFFSPRIGVTYTLLNNLSCYTNISYSQREPSDDDLYNDFSGADELGATPLFASSDTIRSGGRIRFVEWSNPYVKPESVTDFEIGIGYITALCNLKANVYYMDFSNEIIMLGDRDKEGRPIKGNADKTIHKGVEIQAEFSLKPYMRTGGNLSLSKNYFKSFIQKNDQGEKDLSGNDLAGFPGWLANFYMAFTVENLNTTIFWRYVGKRFLDNTSMSERSMPSYNLFDLNLSYGLKNISLFPDLRIFFRINNLFNTEYETYGYYDRWYETSYLYPGAPRNYYLGVTLNM